ncbi:LysR family transcriptional regulator [Erwinia sp. INIA-01]|uniref:LysR family transcriptional regulator n=1 Tax=Erwinia sp. INIA01 TaxID=2991500 RepID=UPI00222422A4|nr:LysR family transcriptional regulator [Erwinia sp. INIA01]MCW1874962.1 LysR family transcriptional regulator [Erwinia sp. INIA01]
MNKLESMAVFVRVVERGSFSAVADDMRLSGTMIGLHIKALESHLGVRLLNRTTRRQSLTDFGQEYYQRCRRILADIEETESLAQVQQQDPRGKLRVACPVSFGVHALSPVTARFLTRWPELTLDLVLSDKAIDMAEESIDVMIKIGDLENLNSLVARPLASYRSIVCASPDYLHEAGTPATPEELSRHRCLGFAHPLAGSEWTLHQGNKSIRVPVNIVMSVNSGEALRSAALNGLGIMMQPEVLIADDVREGRLVPLLSEYQPVAKPVHIVTFADRRQLPKIRLYVDFLLQQFRESLCLAG